MYPHQEKSAQLSVLIPEFQYLNRSQIGVEGSDKRVYLLGLSGTGSSAPWAELQDLTSVTLSSGICFEAVWKLTKEVSLSSTSLLTQTNRCVTA